MRTTSTDQTILELDTALHHLLAATAGDIWVDPQVCPEQADALERALNARAHAEDALRRARASYAAQPHLHARREGIVREPAEPSTHPIWQLKLSLEDVLEATAITVPVDVTVSHQGVTVQVVAQQCEVAAVTVEVHDTQVVVHTWDTTQANDPTTTVLVEHLDIFQEEPVCAPPTNTP